MPNNNTPSSTEIAAFKQLFQAHYEAIRGYLYYKCGSMPQAEDLAQETFALAWKKRDTIRKDQAKNYLYTIATNLFINEAKHQQVVLRFQNQSTDRSFADDPQFEMEVNEFRKMLEDSISALPEKQREVFLMNRIEKQTYNEIATNLGLSVKAVEKRMHQALKALRKISSKI